MKNKNLWQGRLKLWHLLQWRTVDDGFTCYLCKENYIGKQRVLIFCGELACKTCAKKQGVRVISDKVQEVA